MEASRALTRNEMQVNAGADTALPLTLQQRRATALLAAGMRKADVARSVGVDPATVWRWEQDAPFRAAVARELRAVLDATRGLVIESRLKALRLLTETVDDAAVDRRDRVAAARAILSACPALDASVPAEEPEEESEQLFAPNEMRLIAHQILRTRQAQRRSLSVVEGHVAADP